MKLISSTLFHASPHDFLVPDYDQIIANRTNHENGLLGLWAAEKSDWIRSFGGHIYQVEVSGLTQPISARIPSL